MHRANCASDMGIHVSLLFRISAERAWQSGRSTGQRAGLEYASPDLYSRNENGKPLREPWDLVGALWQKLRRGWKRLREWKGI